MAIIAIFCDGTWNSPRNPRQTHVERLCRVCENSEDQNVFYFSGVGTGVGTMGFFEGLLDRFGGGLFGWGLNRNIKSAYLELCRTYQPADKIMLFGFSRGAYTARSLAGMIRKCGILEEPTPERVNEAFRLYRMRGEENEPDAEHIIAMRRKLSPRFATRYKDGMARGDDSALVRITYLAVWDTVGALGVPGSILGPVARWWNQQYMFHDTRLSHLVEHARHAVALDEKRVFFEPALWRNLSDTGEGPGLNRGDISEHRRYQQIWFAGVHSTIGGSTKDQSLASASLAWVFAGANELGLKLGQGFIVPEVPVDPTRDAPEIGAYSIFYRVLPWLLQWRMGPGEKRNLHPTVDERLDARPDYRPASLDKLNALHT